MKKITEIKETRYRTVHEKDKLGKRTKRQVAYTGLRQVNVVSGWTRFGGYILDIVCIRVIIYGLSYLLFLQLQLPVLFTMSITLGVLSIRFFSIFLLLVFYFLFEAFLQRTPGKFALGTRVIDVYGNRPDLGSVALRTISRIVPFEPLSCFDGRGWHDRWSNTFVVSNEEYLQLRSLLSQDEVMSGLPGDSLDSSI